MSSSSGNPMVANEVPVVVVSDRPVVVMSKDEGGSWSSEIRTGRVEFHSEKPIEWSWGGCAFLIGGIGMAFFAPKDENFNYRNPIWGPLSMTCVLIGASILFSSSEPDDTITMKYI